MAVVLCATDAGLSAQPPALEVVFPAGGRAGQATDVTLHGGQLEAASELRCSVPASRSERAGAGAFRLTLPDDTPPGFYDVWAVGANGISAARTFAVGNRPECMETETNDVLSAAMPVSLDGVINGRIEKPGDVDQFRFTGRRGDSVVIECHAERIDSTLRAVLEVTDAAGRRLAVNRGYFGIDPAVVLRVPENGEYIVRVQDLVGTGSPLHVYRLAIGTGPRVVFTVPNVIQRGTTSRVALYGWNLPGGSAEDGFDRLDVDLTGGDSGGKSQTLWRSKHLALADSSMTYVFPDTAMPVTFGLTDAPVIVDGGQNHAVADAEEIAIPSDVSGQLRDGDESDWYAMRVQRGEVLYVEAFGERIGSPVDLQLAVCDGEGHELTAFGDELTNLGGTFETNHLDPGGRWVCPADGRYLLSIRNLTGGLARDPRRTYRLSVRREEPAFHVVARPQGEGPTGLNVAHGGRLALDLLAIRERGMDGAIRVLASDLPPGIECPDVWLGPGVSRGVLVVSADDATAAPLTELKLKATADEDPQSTAQRVEAGTIVRSGTPGGRGRLTSALPVAVAGSALVRISARADEPLPHHLYGDLKLRHSPGSILDVRVEVARRDSTHLAPVKLVGAGLPDGIENESAIIPAGDQSGWISFRLPPDLPTGMYSLVIKGETTAAGADGKVEAVQVVSNPVSFRVEPAAFLVEIDPFAVTQVRRGETFTLAYSAKRMNGFIGKMHTELAVPGKVTDVPGLRGRGETFVSQTETGSLQVVVNDDAPIGPQRFLRLLTVGVVEDEPTYFGSCWVPLEIVE